METLLGFLVFFLTPTAVYVKTTDPLSESLEEAFWAFALLSVLGLTALSIIF